MVLRALCAFLALFFLSGAFTSAFRGAVGATFFAFALAVACAIGALCITARHQALVGQAGLGAMRGLWYATTLLLRGAIAAPALWGGITLIVTGVLVIWIGSLTAETLWVPVHIGSGMLVAGAALLLVAYNKAIVVLDYLWQHRWASILTLCVVWAILVLIHPKWANGPMIMGVIVLAICATITLLDGWAKVREFLFTWLFTKGWMSLLLWVTLITTSLFGGVVYTVYQGGTPSPLMAGLISWYVGAIALLVIIGLITLWNKK